jgi:hypothetical protein
VYRTHAILPGSLGKTVVATYESGGTNPVTSQLKDKHVNYHPLMPRVRILTGPRLKEVVSKFNVITRVDLRIIRLL